MHRDGDTVLDNFVFDQDPDMHIGAATQRIEHHHGGMPQAINFLNVETLGKPKSARTQNKDHHNAGGGGAVRNQKATSRIAPELKGQALVGQVNKLSNWGFSINPRFLKLNKKGLAYFSKQPPLEEMKDSAEQVESLGEQYKPKEAVPIEAIIEVAPISDDERIQHKKFFKEDEIKVFKVVFQEKEMKKKKDIVPQSDEQSMAQLDLDDIKNGQELIAASEKAPKGVKTWWFSLDQQVTKNSVLLKDWILNISIFAKRANQDFKFCEMARHSLQEIHKKMEANLRPSTMVTPALTPSRIDTLNQQTDNNTHNDSFENIRAGNIPLQKQKQMGRMKQFSQENDGMLNKNFAEQEENKKNKQKHTDDENRATSQNSGQNSEKDQLDAYQGLKIRQDKQMSNNRIQQQQAQMHKRSFNDETDKEVRGFYERGIKKQEKKQSKENRGWDLKFQKFTDYVINAQSDMERNFKLSERLLDHVREFRKNATSEVIKIVNNLGDRRSYKTLVGRKDLDGDQVLKTIELFCDEDMEVKNSEMIFFEPQLHNMIIKLTHPADTVDCISPQEDDQDNLKKRKGFRGNGVQKRQLYKQYAREILSRDVIYDATLISTRDGSDKTRLRVPLSAMVDYKGFRAMVTGYVGLDDHELRLGFRQGNYFTAINSEERRIDETIQELRNIGIVLNLKENRFNQKSAGQQSYKRIPISSFIQVFANTSGQRETKSDDESDEVLKYFFDHHFKDLDYDKDPQNYIMRTSEIFPFDVDPQDSNMEFIHRDKVLRPELVCANEKSLRADTKKRISYAQKKTQQSSQGASQHNNDFFQDNGKENCADSDDLVLANSFLRNTKIPQLVSLLDSLVIIPIDSQALEEAFHTMGVNMRYLGSVAKMSKLKHVKDLCLTDMLARTLKRFFNTACSELILNNQKHREAIISKKNMYDRRSKEQGLSDQQTTINLNLSHTRSRLEDAGGIRDNKMRNQKEELTRQQKEQIAITAELDELNKSIDQKVKEWILDFMNLIFGESDETRQFWDEVLLPSASIYYSFELIELKKFDRNLNALFYALVEHLSLKVIEPEGVSEAQAEDHLNKRTSLLMQQQQLANIQNNALNSKNNALPKQQQTERDIDPFFKEFEKSEFPFGSLKKEKDHNHAQKYEFQLIPKTRTYQFRNLMYSTIAHKFRDYKNNGALIEAFETCKMRKHMTKCLRGHDDELSTKLDLCLLQLENKQWESAKKMALKAKEDLCNGQRSQHATAIQFQTILVQSYYMSGEFQQAEKEFTEALKILDHHWGPYHPLHIDIYGIMAQLLILNQKYEDATYLYKASLRCCMRIIGPNHIQTGEVHMDYARLQLTKANRDENTSKGLQQKNDSLQHFMEAFNIFKNYFDSDKCDALQTAEAAIEIANLLEAENRMSDAFPYAQVASQTYQSVYAQDNERIIETMWRELTIAYAIEWSKTEEIAADLFYALAKRDYIISIGDVQRFQRNQQNNANAGSFGKDMINLEQQKKSREKTHNNNENQTVDKTNATGITSDDQQFISSPVNETVIAALNAHNQSDKIEKRINEIKVSLIATIIMEKTRTLKRKQKKKVKAFCDKVLFDEMFDETEGVFREQSKDHVAKNLQQYHYSNMNPLRILSVRNLDIAEQEATQLLTMYTQAYNKIDWMVPEDVAEIERRKFSFHYKYESMIKRVEDKASELKHAYEDRANSNYSQSYDHSTTILFENQGGGSIADGLNTDVDTPFVYQEGEIMGSQVNENMTDSVQNETLHQFYLKLIRIFEKKINFYNLLDIKQDQTKQKTEQLCQDEI